MLKIIFAYWSIKKDGFSLDQIHDFPIEINLLKQDLIRYSHSTALYVRIHLKGLAKTTARQAIERLSWTMLIGGRQAANEQTEGKGDSGPTYGSHCGSQLHRLFNDANIQYIRKNQYNVD